MKLAPLVIVLFVLLPSVSADCLKPRSGLVVSSTVTLCSGSYTLDQPLEISGVDVHVICDATELSGKYAGTGVYITPSSSGVLERCFLSSFRDAIFLAEESKLEVRNTEILDSSNGVSLASDAVFLGEPKYTNVVQERVTRTPEEAEEAVIPGRTVAAGQKPLRVILPQASPSVLNQARQAVGLTGDDLGSARTFVDFVSKNAFVLPNETTIVLTVKARADTPTLYVYEVIGTYAPIEEYQTVREGILEFVIPELARGEEYAVSYVLQGNLEDIDSDPPVSIISATKTSNRSITLYVGLSLVLLLLVILGVILSRLKNA